VSDAYDYFQQGRGLLGDGMPAQATVPLEKAKKLEPDRVLPDPALAGG
jgi:hypothetical protein